MQPFPPHRWFTERAWCHQGRMHLLPYRQFNDLSSKAYSGSFLWSGDPAALAAYKYFQFCCSCRNLFLRSGSLPVRQGHLPEIMLSCRTDSLTENQIKKCTNHFLSPPYRRLAVHVPFYMRTATIYKRERNASAVGRNFDGIQ